MKDRRTTIENKLKEAGLFDKKVAFQLKLKVGNILAKLSATQESIRNTVWILYNVLKPIKIQFKIQFQIQFKIKIKINSKFNSI